MNFKNLISFTLFLIIVGCEKQNTNNENSLDITIITPDYEEESFYLNLTTGLENSQDWHVSLQKMMVTSGVITAPLPTIITNSSSLISIENNIDYDDLITLPANINWLADTTLLSHGGDYVVLDYQFLCENPNHDHPPSTHKILVWDFIYLFKIIETGRIYKIKFEEYESGIVLFKYSEIE